MVAALLSPKLKSTYCKAYMQMFMEGALGTAPSVSASEHLDI
jgi:hypothetical protein